MYKLHPNHARFNYGVLGEWRRCNMAKDNNSSVSVSCGGCLGTVLLIVGVWALVFGVTVSGKHYGVSGCDTDHGVKVDR